MHKTLPTVLLDIDETCVQKRELEFDIFNRALNANLHIRDFPTTFSMKDAFGITREQAMQIRGAAAHRVLEAKIMPGFLPAIKLLYGHVRFDMATAREEATRTFTEQHVSSLMSEDTRVFFCACPSVNCDNPECQTRIQKLELAREIGAIALVDDHVGEFTTHETSPEWISLICYRQPWNKNIPTFFPRLGWAGIVTHIRELIAR